MISNKYLITNKVKEKSLKIIHKCYPCHHFVVKFESLNVFPDTLYYRYTLLILILLMYHSNVLCAWALLSCLFKEKKIRTGHLVRLFYHISTSYVQY